MYFSKKEKRMKTCMTSAACTIVSLNYLPYARTLCDSFLSFHTDCKFYVLLVDRLPQDFDSSADRFEMVLVEDLNISNFESVAFKYDILELNTNVKPTFLKYLLAQGIEQLIYLDPDICIYSSLSLIYDAAASSSVVLTPHSLSPNREDVTSDVNLLALGIFNLGFIAVSKSDEASNFLAWWEENCLNHGFSDPAGGLFVDQKWVNLAPCFLTSLKILKHPGCNVAYWNLHERIITWEGNRWIVNGVDELVFYHFSGISVDGGNRISKHLDRLDLTSRPEMARLFAEYRENVVRHGIRELVRLPYAFGAFNNGKFINKLTRSVYAANLGEFLGSDPFDASGPFYARASSGGLLSKKDSFTRYTRKTYSKGGWRVQILHRLMRMCLRIFGADRYTVLMKYCGFISRLRNQPELLPSSRPGNIAPQQSAGTGSFGTEI
jgi:hypothetical protein